MRNRSDDPPGTVRDIVAMLKDAHRDLFEVSVELRNRNKGTVGQHGPVRAPSLNQLPAGTRRSMQKWLADGEGVTPRIFCELLCNVRLPPDQVLEYVRRYCDALLRRDLAACLCILSEALTLDEGTSSGDVTIMRATVQTEISLITVRGRTMSAELGASQELMKTSDRFGWVTDVRPGFEITAPSAPVAALLDIPLDQLDGSYLLEDPVRSRLQEAIANFGEWILIIGMLTYSSIRQWRQDEDYSDYRIRVKEFFRWLGQHVREHEEEVASQVAATPDQLVDGKSSREDLQDCLQAALRRGYWPRYHPTRWNSMRVHVRQHPLLPPGKVAKFQKTSSPIYHGQAIIGYEVLWQAEKADRVANGLMFDILQSLKLA